MAKTKYIIFTANVYAVQAGKLKDAIVQAVNDKYDELYFLISSGGGDVFEGLSIASIIRSLPIKTVTHNIGQVDSVATAIFSAGQERLSNQNASFLFHGVTMNVQGGGLLEQQLRELHESSKRLKSDIAKSISSYTGISIEKVNELMVDGGAILSPEEGMIIGLVSKIQEANIPQNSDIICINNN